MFTYKKIDYKKDVQEVVALLQKSMNGSHTVKSFLWKHYENPFGKSYGLLAYNQDEIVGVRMFMAWEFRKGQKIIKAIRPVDTATHPDFRRKGIFKNLTLKGLENCKGNYDLVFNTPNENSLAGYLKMGWKKYPKELRFVLAFVSPFNRSKNIQQFSVSKLKNRKLELEFLFFATNTTSQHLQWRYSSNDYEAVSLEFGSGTLFLVFKIKKIRGIKVIVVTEFIGDAKYYSLAIKSLSSKLGIYFVYYLANELLDIDAVFYIKRNCAVVTFKEDSKDIIEKIVFSSGDLEGRL